MQNYFTKSLNYLKLYQYFKLSGALYTGLQNIPPRACRNICSFVRPLKDDQKVAKPLSIKQ